MYARTTKVDYDEVRCLVNDAALSNFFRGLVSARLGSDRSVDDELIDLIVTNHLVSEVFDDFCCTEGGRAKIDKALDDIFSKLRSGEEGTEAKAPKDSGEYKPDDNDACRVVWMQAVSDPRFDVVLKEAIDDSKLPPPVVRGSGLSTVMGLLDKIRAALTSGTTKHTDAVLAASIIAALLAGGAGGHYIPEIVNSNTVTTGASAGKSNIDPIAGELHSIAKELQKQNLHDQQISTLESQVTQRNEAITNLQQEFNTQYADLSKRVAATSVSQIEQLQTSVATLTNSLAETNEDLRLTDNSLKGQIRVSEQVKDSLQQIAYGIGPPQEKDNGLPSVRASLSTVKEPLQQIAYGIGPPQGKDDGLPSLRASSQQIKDPLQQIAYGIADKPVANGGATSSSSPAPSTIAASLKALENDVRTSDKSFFREFSIETTASDAPLKKADGQDCKVTWALISVSAQNTMIQVKSNDCGIDLPNESKVVLDHTRTRFPGTNLEFSFERPERMRFWPLSPKGAIVAVYQNPVPPIAPDRK